MKVIDRSAPISAQSTTGSPSQDDGPYLNPEGFNQHFLSQRADIKQIWDFSTIAQVQSDGFLAVRNAMNAFQFAYQKTLFLIICLRGQAVIYALDDTLWQKYRLGTLFGQGKGGLPDQNPFYHRQTSDPNDLSQDASVQALLQRGSSLAVCHDALNGLAVQLSSHGVMAPIIFQELAAHLISGAQQTPSGSSLIAVAQHLGFTYAKQ
jgi:hypothetical protein